MSYKERNLQKAFYKFTFVLIIKCFLYSYRIFALFPEEVKREGSLRRGSNSSQNSEPPPSPRVSDAPRLPRRSSKSPAKVQSEQLFSSSSGSPSPPISPDAANSPPASPLTSSAAIVTASDKAILQVGYDLQYSKVDFNFQVSHCLRVLSVQDYWQGLDWPKSLSSSVTDKKILL